MSALLMLLVAPLLSGADPLAECRRLDQSFDTKGMPPVCAAAVDDATRPVADRADAARLWAFALFTNGDIAGAEAALLRMLTLVPSARLPDGASPRLQEVFNKAKARFDVEAVVVVDASAALADDGVHVAFSAKTKDTYARVSRLRGVLSSNHVDVREVALIKDAGKDAGKDAADVYAGVVNVPDVVADGCRVDAIGNDGSVIATGACTAPAVSAAAVEDGPPWLAIGVGAGAAVVVVGAIVGGVVYAVAANPAPAAVTVTIE